MVRGKAAVRTREKHLFQAVRVKSGLFQTELGIRERSYDQFYANTTTAVI